MSFPIPRQSVDNTPSRRGSVPHIFIIIAVVCAALYLLVGSTVSPWSLGDAVRTALTIPGVRVVNSILALAATAFFLILVMLETTHKPVATPDKAAPQPWFESPALWAFSIAAIVIAWRWPFLSHYELNVDESQDIAAALTLLTDPRYWQSTDTMTHGPLISYVLTLPQLLGGMIPDYGSARLVGLVLMIGSLLCLNGVFYAIFARNRARLFLAPAVLMVAFITTADFLAYNGEHLPIFLCAAAAYCAVRARQSETRYAIGFNMLTGLILGLMPWAKIQGLPMAAIIGLLTILSQWKPFGNLERRESQARIGSLCLAATIPTLGTLIYVFSTGIESYFFHSYFIWIAEYSATQPLEHKQSLLHNLLWPLEFYRAEAFAFWLVLSTVIGIAGLIYAKYLHRFSATPALLWSSALVFAASYFAVCRPERNYEHYLLFLQFPLCFLVATLWNQLFDFARSEAGGKYYRPVVATFITLNLAIPTTGALLSHARFNPLIGDPVVRSAYTAPWHSPKQSQERADDQNVARAIRRYIRQGEPVAVWGWAAKYNALASAPQATRDAITFRVKNQHGHFDPFFYAAYLEDLDRNKPAVFVDASGAQSLYKKRLAPEEFPELQKRLDERYRVVDRVKNVFIYVRKDRVSDSVPTVSRQLLTETE